MFNVLFQLKEETTRRSEIETKSEMLEEKIKTYESEIEKLKEQVGYHFKCQFFSNPCSFSPCLLIFENAFVLKSLPKQ